MTFHTETDVSASIFGHHWTEAGALSEKSLGPRTASVALQLATCNVQRDSPVLICHFVVGSGCSPNSTPPTTEEHAEHGGSGSPKRAVAEPVICDMACAMCLNWPCISAW